MDDVVMNNEKVLENSKWLTGIGFLVVYKPRKQAFGSGVGIFREAL